MAGVFTHDLPAVHRLIRERYGAAAYLAQYTDTRRGVASAHPFAVIDGAVHGAYDPQNLATPQPITHIYVPPPGWTPPGFQIDSDRLRARNERERVRQDAGRGATPTEITQDIEDIYERVAAGTNLTDSQAAEIRLAIREAQEAAAEASAAADRAHLLSNAAQGFLRGARADLDRSQSTGGADTGEFDGRELADPEPNATPTEPGILHGPEIPDASPDLATDPFAVADPGPDSEGDLLSVPGQSGRRLTLEELQEVAAVGADPRSPADINDRALYKAEKADAIADEAVQASQEAVLAASRMTRAFARLRELAREANRRADALPDDVDDVAQTYADMADAEIDGTMPLVERTNRAALQSRDLALMVAEEADDLLDDVRQFRGSLQNDLGEAYSPPTPEEQARGRASERYTRELATGAELEARITELQSRVGARQTASGPPAPVVNENDGVKLQPSLTPGRVYIPEGQPTMLGKDSRGRTVRGYEVSGDFYPTGDLSPVMDPDTGQQSYQDPPDWLDQSDPRARRRLLYTTNILPWIKPPPASGPSESQPEPPPGPKDLRDYQERIITELDDALDQENSVLVTAPTGAGKTVAFAEKIRRLRAEGKNVAVIAHRQELIEQAEKTIAAQTGETPGVVWQNRREWGRPITIIAHGALLTNDPPVGYRPDVVIADEAHHAIAPGWQQAIDKLHAKQLIGFTATPFRSDELPLTPKPFARVINPVTPAQLIEKGVLVPPKVESVALTDDQGAPQPINKASNLPQVYAESVSYALSQGRRKIIVFVSQSTDDSPSEVAKNTEQELKRLGINTRTIIAGGLTPNERREAIKEFEEAPSAVMVNYMTLTEGTDVPSTDTVILGRNTQSETSLIQMIGRGMRPSAGKRNVLVLDFTGRDDIADIVNYWRVDAGESNRAKAGGTLQSLATDSDTQHQPGPAKHKGLATSPKVMRRGANAPDGPQSNATPGRRANAIYRRKDAPRPKSTSGESDYPDASRAVRGSRTRRRRTDADLATSNGPGELTITINEQAGR